MPRSHIHGLDAGLATDTIQHHLGQSVLVRSFLPFNLIFIAEFKKISAEIPLTPSYLEPC